MAQQNKNNKQPTGFGGFDDLISDFSEDEIMPPKAKSVSHQPAAPTVSRPEPLRTPSPSPPRSNDPPKPTPAAKTNTTQDTQLIHLDDWIEMTAAESPKPPTQPQTPKPETRVIVEPKPVPSSLPKAAEEGSQKALWFSVACGVFFLIWLVSGPDKSQTSSRTVSNIEARYEPVTTQSITTTENGMYECYQNGMTFYRTQPCPVTTQSITRIEPIYKPKTPLITEKNKSAPEKPSTPKAEPDPLVKEIQKKLLSLGYSPGPADGYVGQKTLNAIRQFQKENKLPIDPKMNEKLLASLDHAQPRVVPQRRQELSSSHSVKNEEKDDVCPVGEICVRKLKESFSSSSDDIQISNQQPVYSSNTDTSPPQTPAGSPSKHRNTRIVCPTAIFCYPQPY